MNIRRGFLALAAMILGVGIFGAFPQPAQASVVVCQPTNPSQSDFPYGNWTQRCGAITSAEGQQMSGMVNSIVGQAKQELKRANNGNLPDSSNRPLNGMQFFLFANPQDYIDSAATLGLSPVTFTPALDADDYAFSVVKFDANNVPVYAAVFKTNKVGRTFANAIRNGTATAAARGSDYLQGYIKNGGIQPPVNYRISDTGAGFRAMFERMLERDYQIINDPNTLACKNPTTNAPGFFSGYSDKDGVFICNGTNGNGTALSATYAGLNNRAALNKAWPHIYPAVPPGGPGTAATGYYAGFYAELYATKAVSGASDTTQTGKTQDAYFTNGQFECTIWFVQNIPNQGFLDNVALPASCGTGAYGQSVDPTSLMTTKCRKLFSATGGQFPNGNVFNCTAALTAHAQQVQQGLNGLGRLAPAPALEVTNIKSEFSKRRANIFVFDDTAAYTAAFNAAGELVGQLDVFAGTYPNPTAQAAWYTILFRSVNNGQFFPTSGELIYTSTHELGHVFDDTHSPQPSSTVTYDTAVQNDWLKLDYVDFSKGAAGKRNPCGTQALDMYVGPLINVNDPLTIDAAHPDGIPFCNGNVIRNNPAYTNKKTSEILKFAYPDANDAVKKQVARHFGPPAPNGYDALAGWRELHSEAFAVRAQLDVGGVAPAIDMPQIVGNGYFTCIAGPFINGYNSWARTEYTTAAAVPPSSAPCQTALPAGWVPIN